MSFRFIKYVSSNGDIFERRIYGLLINEVDVDFSLPLDKLKGKLDLCLIQFSNPHNPLFKQFITVFEMTNKSAVVTCPKFSTKLHSTNHLQVKFSLNPRSNTPLLEIYDIYMGEKALI